MPRTKGQVANSRSHLSRPHPRSPSARQTPRPSRCFHKQSVRKRPRNHEQREDCLCIGIFSSNRRIACACLLAYSIPRFEIPFLNSCWLTVPSAFSSAVTSNLGSDKKAYKPLAAADACVLTERTEKRPDILALCLQFVGELTERKVT